MLEDAVVTLVPLLQASPDIRLCGARFKTHVGVGKVVFHLVVLRRKVVCFGFPLLSYEPGELVALMQVVRDRPQVVKELAEQVPSAFALHHICAEQEIAGGFNGIP
jgi:hypothetical protein